MKATLLTSALLSAFAVTASAASSRLTGGHIDAPAFGYVSVFAAGPTGTPGFEPHLHNEGGADGAIIDGVRVETGSEYEPDEIVIVVPEFSVTTYDSKQYYWLPQDETDAANNGAPFIGIGLEELDPSDWNGNLTLALNSFSGPGEFLLWQDGFGGGEVFLNSLNLGLSFTLTPGSHTHFNWGFTEPGVYQLEFRVSGNHVVDGFQSGTGTYTFEVIPEPSAALLGMLGGLTIFRRRRD